MTDQAESDRLYGLALEEFTPARDELAKRLRSAGDAAAAAAVKSAKKPTTPAWAVNQLARRQRALVEDLIEAVDRLKAAQHELLSGGTAQSVWQATLHERDIAARLAHEAERVLEGQGYGATRATLDRIVDTLTAAAADPRTRDRLRRGVLTSEMQRAGFGLLDDGVPDVAEVKPRVAGSKKKAPAGRPAAKKGKASAKAERVWGPTPRAVLEAERAAVRARRAAERADDNAVRLEREAGKVADEAASARKRMEAAERDATKAKAAATDARKEANAALRDADRAEGKLAKLNASRKR